MHDIQTFTGRIIELRRFMNRRPRITEHDPSRERWEMWLAAPDGSEHKYVVARGGSAQGVLSFFRNALRD